MVLSENNITVARNIHRKKELPIPMIESSPQIFTRSLSARAVLFCWILVLPQQPSKPVEKVFHAAKVPALKTPTKSAHVSSRIISEHDGVKRA